MSKTLTLAATGASGIPYALRLLQVLVQGGVHVNVLFSQAAYLVAAMEMDLKLPKKPDALAETLATQLNIDATLITAYDEKQWQAPMASGSNCGDGMVVCPCSSGFLSAVATGQSDNLPERAADVMLKEKKPLILVHRETPLSRIHIENMLRVTDAGATLLPANPGFYHSPKSIDDLVDFVVARICDHLQVPHTIGERWGD